MNISNPKRVQPSPKKLKFMKINQLKDLGTFLNFLNKLSKLPAKDTETLSQKEKIEDLFSKT